MALNLGFESLNAGYSPNSISTATLTRYAVEMQECSNLIDRWSASLDDVMTGYANLVSIRNTIRKYGVTASLKSLVGTEAIAMAQSLEDEQPGVWQKIKNFLVGIWTKICEWWNRFWGLLFSNKKKLEAAIKRAKNIKGALPKITAYPEAFVGDTQKEIITFIQKFFKLTEFSDADKNEAKNLAEKLTTAKKAENIECSAAYGTNLLRALNIMDSYKTAITNWSKKNLEAAKKIDNSEESKKKITMLKDLAKAMNQVVRKYAGMINSVAGIYSAHVWGKEAAAPAASGTQAETASEKPAEEPPKATAYWWH